jgi:hypothetical protein
MTVTYTGQCTRKCGEDDECVDGCAPVGTMTCDQKCGAVFGDGKPEAGRSGIHTRAREAGWQFCRPTPYLQTDVCPDCPPHEHY